MIVVLDFSQTLHSRVLNVMGALEGHVLHVVVQRVLSGLNAEGLLESHFFVELINFKFQTLNYVLRLGKVGIKSQ